MTTSPGTQVSSLAKAAEHGVRLLPPARYRHPGDVIRLIIAGLVLAGTLAVTVATHATYAGASAAAVAAFTPPALAGRVLAGLVQAVLVTAAAAAVVATLRHRRFRLLAGLAGAAVLAGCWPGWCRRSFVTAAAAAVVVTLRYRRFRLLASLAGAAVLASAVVIGIIQLAGGQRPRDLAAGAGQWPWLTGGSLAGPALLAAAVAVTVAAAPWLSRPWRRAAWVTLWLAAVVRLITGTASPVEVVVAFAAGVAAGAGVLVLFGVPDRRIGPQGIAAALGSAGLPVTSVEPAGVEAKGSRPFVAAAGDGKPLFIKVLGSDQRDADLLYRAYRFIRLREVGDTRPAASLIQAVEHQALAAVMAERAGVAVPAVRQVIKTADGSALLAMDRVDGSSLDQIPEQRLSDTMLRKLWEQVDRLHRARIAHRSLRAANIVADGTGRPWVVDFSFSELGATQRQMALDVAELLASLAAIIGADRAVATAAAGHRPRQRGGRGAVAAAAGSVRWHPPRGRPPGRPADQDPGGRRRGERPGGPGTGPHPARPPQDTAGDRRGRGRVLLPAPSAGPGEQQLAGRPVGRLGMAAPGHRLVGDDLPGQRGRAHRRGAAADPVLAHRAGPGRLLVRQPRLPGQRRRHGAERPVPAEDPGWRPAPASPRSGSTAWPAPSCTWFCWSSSSPGPATGSANAFKLPSSSKLLLILAIIAAIIGIVLATRPGRRFAAGKLIPGLKSAAASLRRVARNPVKMIMLFGGSALITLAYVGALAASVQAFGGGPGVILIGAVYMGAAAIAAAAPSPGGLGAIEAALVAGLTGVGMQAGPAVSAVLLYRLATYWLPVAPGWLSWRALQRRDYV